MKYNNRQDGHEVVGEAENRIDCINKYKYLKPDVVLMDITMPDMDGIEATKKMRKEYTESHLI